MVLNNKPSRKYLKYIIIHGTLCHLHIRKLSMNGEVISNIVALKTSVNCVRTAHNYNQEPHSL